MLKVLEKHLNLTLKSECIVAKWITTLPEEEQHLFEKIRENKDVSVASLFNELSKEVELPFKLTAFRGHLRGYCTCQL